jgi:hypothetical protein
MTEDENDILDLPETKSEEEESRWFFLVLLSFAILAAGLVGMFFQFPAFKMLISVGLGLLLFRTLLVFVLYRKRQPYEYLYLIAMVVLVSASVLSMLELFTGRLLFVIAFVLFALGMMLVKNKPAG